MVECSGRIRTSCIADVLCKLRRAASFYLRIAICEISIAQCDLCFALFELKKVICEMQFATCEKKGIMRYETETEKERADYLG